MSIKSLKMRLRWSNLLLNSFNSLKKRKGNRELRYRGSKWISSHDLKFRSYKTMNQRALSSTHRLIHSIEVPPPSPTSFFYRQRITSSQLQADPSSKLRQFLVMKNNERRVLLVPTKHQMMGMILIRDLCPLLNSKFITLILQVVSWMTLRSYLWLWAATPLICGWLFKAAQLHRVKNRIKIRIPVRIVIILASKGRLANYWIK
jgi:hypothetical protein